MSVTELKEVLHQAIEAINDGERLERMLGIANEKATDSSEEQIAVLKERERKLATGESRLITWEEVDAKIQAKYGF